MIRHNGCYLGGGIMSNDQITGIFTYDVKTKKLYLDCTDKKSWCVSDILAFPVLVAQDKARCYLDSGDESFIALNLVFDNELGGLLVFAHEEESLVEYHRHLESVRRQSDRDN